jgi:hypothetical protein
MDTPSPSHSLLQQTGPLKLFQRQPKHFIGNIGGKLKFLSQQGRECGHAGLSIAMFPNQGSGWVQEISLILLWVNHAQFIVDSLRLGLRYSSRIVHHLASLTDASHRLTFWLCSFGQARIQVSR